MFPPTWGRWGGGGGIILILFAMRSHCRAKSTSPPPVVAGSASKCLFGSGGGSPRAERKAGIAQPKAANVLVYVIHIRSHTWELHVEIGQGVAAACDFATHVRQFHANINISDRHAQFRRTPVHHQKQKTLAVKTTPHTANHTRVNFLYQYSTAALPSLCARTAPQHGARCTCCWTQLRKYYDNISDTQERFGLRATSCDRCKRCTGHKSRAYCSTLILTAASSSSSTLTASIAVMSVTEDGWVRANPADTKNFSGSCP